jgi:hypothetical protein
MTAGRGEVLLRIWMVSPQGAGSCPQEAPRARQLLQAAEWYVGDSDDDQRENAVMEKTKITIADTAPAEGAATATAETAHPECYISAGEAAAHLNVLGGLDSL